MPYLNEFVGTLNDSPRNPEQQKKFLKQLYGGYGWVRFPTKRPKGYNRASLEKFKKSLKEYIEQRKLKVNTVAVVTHGNWMRKKLYLSQCPNNNAIYDYSKKKFIYKGKIPISRNDYIRELNNI